MSKSEHDGRRKCRRDFPRRIPDLGYYCIVTDTDETEANYFHGLRDSLPQELQRRIVIKVLKAETDQLVHACEEERSKQPQFAQYWIVFDRDEVVNFDEIIKEASLADINVGWSNPCIEIWFDAYFKKIHSYHDSVSCCRGFSETFERKTGQEYKKAKQDIYALLNRYGDEQAAITLAENRLTQHQNNGITKPSNMCPCTTIQHLVREIVSKKNP